MDLTRVSALEIGSVLDRARVAWNYDDDGDVRVRFRSSQPPGIDLVFYQFDTATADFSMRGQFLRGRAVPQDNGMMRWEVPLDSGHEPTAVAQKVVTVYLMPRPGSVNVQIHASISPLSQPRPSHIKVIPGDRQVNWIERQFPGFVRTESNTHFWISSAVTGVHVDEMEFLNLIHTCSQVGLAMFDGPFTGRMYSTDA
jgi:hypothetical protein